MHSLNSFTGSFVYKTSLNIWYVFLGQWWLRCENLIKEMVVRVDFWVCEVSDHGLCQKERHGHRTPVMNISGV